MTIRPIAAHDTHALRQQVLRANQPNANVNYPGDEAEGSIHFGGFDGETLVCIASLYDEPMPETQDEDRHVRLRGMAVSADRAGQGLGRQLLRHCLDHSRDRGATLFWCNARESASGFYADSGFEKRGEAFEIEIIGTHYVMFRRL